MHENPGNQGTSLNHLAKFRAWHGVRDIIRIEVQACEHSLRTPQEGRFPVV